MAEGPRQARLASTLDELRARCDVEDRRARDPVGAVHRYSKPEDQELVALLASSIAFGNVATIRAKLEDALARVGPHPARAADDPAALARRLEGWVHRVFIGEDIAHLLAGARAVQRLDGSLGNAFAACLAEAEGSPGSPLRDALAAFCHRVREGGLARAAAITKRRGPAHLLPDPHGASGSKRLLLFLRWMVRPEDGIDLGLWAHQVPANRLLCPVDTHIHKLSLNLGFTKRLDLSWRTAEEITRALARFDAKDPVKYDFALCHMGMLQRCPSRKDPARCEGCGVLPVCRHWGRTGPTGQTGRTERTERAVSPRPPRSLASSRVRAGS